MHLKKVSIENVETELGNKLIESLLHNGWKLKSEYDAIMIDKGVDYDFYTLTFNDMTLHFEWDNWFEWKIEGSASSIAIIQDRIE